MDSDLPTFSDPSASDAALLAACRFVQENQLPAPVLLERWAALQRGWMEHIARYERYTLPRLARRDAGAASGRRSRHLELASKLEQRAIDLELGSACADVAAKIMLDALIAHLSADDPCKFVAPQRRRRRAAS